MQLKLDFSRLNMEPEEKNGMQEAEAQKQEEVTVDNEEQQYDTVDDASTIANNDEFALGSEMEEESQPLPVKKEFAGFNKEILSTPIANFNAEKNNSIQEFIPSNVISVSKDNEYLNNESNENHLNVEDNNEPNLKEPADVTKVICIGGNEKYYKSVLSRINQTDKSIEFVKYVATAGKNAFLMIDALQPDIIMIYHNSQIKDALQFHDAVMNDSDNKGEFYRDKYKNKRILVIASNNISYEIKLKEKGINFYVKEINPQIHDVNVQELIGVIHDAKNDINKIKKIDIEKEEKIKEAEVLSLIEEDDNEPKLDNLPEIPEISITVVPDNDYSEKEQDVIDETVEHEEIVKPKNKDNESISAGQWRKKQLSRQREAVSETSENDGKIIGVYSTTGGAGKTMFSSNLASILSKYSNQDGTSNYKVALVEYNLTCKCLDIFFNIKTNKDIMSLTRDVSSYIVQNEDNTSMIKIEPEQFAPYIKSNMYRINDLNLDVLLDVSTPLETDNIPNNFTNSLFQTLKTMYDVIIVDTSADIGKTPALEAFNMIDEIYYIIPMDVSAIRNTKVLLGFFNGMFGYDKNKIKIIINKVNQENEEFGVDQIFQAFAMDNYVPEGIIPLDNRITSSINRGVPITLEDISNPVSDAIYSIALGINERISAEDVVVSEKKEEKGFFSKLFGGKNKSNEKKGKLLSKKNSKERPSIKNKKVEKVPALMPPTVMPENLPPSNQKKHSVGLFHKRNQQENREQELVSTHVPDDVLQEEKPKKKGFLSRLFGSNKKKKTVTPKIKNKKKSSGIKGLLGQSKKEEHNLVVEETMQNAIPSTAPRQAGLQPVLRRHPRKR